MGAFLGISLWVALATVVPGLVTIAVVSCGAFVIVGGDRLAQFGNTSVWSSDWVVAGVAVTVMVLTQALGILLEEILVRCRLFPWCSKIKVPQDFGSSDETEMDAYDQYDRLYILLAQLEEHEDSQGHLKRAAAQFFLTNNTLVSFLIGIAVSIALFMNYDHTKTGSWIYPIGLLVCLVISYWVAVIRFRVMAKSIWATNTAKERKIAEASTA